MKHKNIILIGMMGTGKTTIGRALSHSTGWKWIDTDQTIEERTGKSIPEMFKEMGEAVFRRFETDILEEHLSSCNFIITTGGGIVLNPINRELMKKIGWVICLHAPVEVIVDRVKGDINRPLLQGNIEERVKTIAEERQPLYNFADYSVDTSKHSVEQIASLIAAFVNDRSSYGL
jgi:shikimate kinase